MNHHSSRSHAIFRIVVKSITNKFIKNYRKLIFHFRLPYRTLGRKKVSNVNNEELLSEFLKDDYHIQTSENHEGTLITESLLNFVDLAGSEKVSNHSAGTQ
jgi:hypothetical protein